MIVISYCWPSTPEAGPLICVPEAQLLVALGGLRWMASPPHLSTIFPPFCRKQLRFDTKHCQ
jgi:hypothetical protein